MYEIIGIIFWLILCGLVGNIAREKGRNWSTGFVLAALLSPLVGFIYYGLTKKKIKTKEETIYDSLLDTKYDWLIIGPFGVAAIIMIIGLILM